MEYRRLGKSGLKVSALSLGSWLTFGKQVDDATASELMHVAYDNGVNFFDNAEIYAKGQSEIVMGNILAKSGWERSSYLVSSKVFWGGDRPNQTGLSRKHVFEACHAALKRLQVDYLDLYFCHRPDPETPIEETVWTMSNLVSQGKILYWGTSEWSAADIATAYNVARLHNLVAPTMEQPQYSMVVRERFESEYASVFRDFGMGTTIWSPLASGLLTGKYNDGFVGDTRLSIPGLDWLKAGTLREEYLEIARKVAIIARELGISMPRLAIAWCLKNPNVSTVILGASKTTQLEENFLALGDVALLTDEVMQRLESALGNRPA